MSGRLRHLAREVFTLETIIEAANCRVWKMCSGTLPVVCSVGPACYNALPRERHLTPSSSLVQDIRFSS